jgi:hypothetical protein
MSRDWPAIADEGDERARNRAMSRKPSAGVKHHHDSTAECPDCGRRFVTHSTVAQQHGYLTLSFESKQEDAPGRWSAAVIPLEEVSWADSSPMLGRPRMRSAAGGRPARTACTDSETLTTVTTTKVEQDWFDHAWDVVNCSDEHRRGCVRHRATSGPQRDGLGDLCFPGYLGREYDGLLCVAAVHRALRPEQHSDEQVRVGRR